MITKIKFIIGVIILIFVFLPLGSCERKAVVPYPPVVTEESFSGVTEKKDPAAQKPNPNRCETDYLIPIKIFEINKPSTWLVIIVFIWPLLLLAIKIYFTKAKWQKFIVSVLELLFAGFSIYIVYSLLYHLWYEPTLWGHLAFIAVVLYFILLVYELSRPYLRLGLKKNDKNFSR